MAKTDIKNVKAQQEQANELLENPDVIADRLGRGEAFLKENSKIVGGIIIAIVLVIAGVIGFQIHKANQNKVAQAEMFQAVYYWEQDEADLALNGDGEHAGFLTIIDKYSGTDAANLAHFYTGSLYLAEGEHQKAIDHLKKFSSSDFFVQARAYALIGDAQMELGQVGDAISSYKRAADYKENKFFTPRYLNKLAIAYEENGDINNAIKTYEQIEEKYFESYEFTAARKHKARLEGLASR
ncbi:tetratricopeptide repeat protein [Litoribacter ruber]|uniref:Tetratricopeptide repeat protein n=1 Tax=Litoribacter ruber TaxID=702568 RepID=A0AAP2CG97_9BACT|nr:MULTISPECIES: tetratricopeptide repeat protein [Litoribacter]MBS9523517.1 tetratricopeptide repeat protein [Litoribacter alkaliphilus]MBT0812066.1 tetratricopeptide repeat protein [Litoribacter ruber]